MGHSSVKLHCLWAILLITLFIISGCNLGIPANATPLPTPDIPHVEILSPQNNQQAIEDVNIVFDVVARDDNPGIALVELYVDEELVNFATPIDENVVPVFRTEINWRAQVEGIHFIEVIAYRPDGQQSDPARLTIEVLGRE